MAESTTKKYLDGEGLSHLWGKIGTKLSGYATTQALESAIAALPSPMQFKGTLGTSGTITTLPAAATANNGHTYRVITAGTYGTQAAKDGDVFISDGSKWIYIPSADDETGVMSVNVVTADHLVKTGSENDPTIGVASGYSIPSTAQQTAWSGKQDALAAQTAYTAKGSATKVPQITTNALGQVTGITEVAITTHTGTVDGGAKTTDVGGATAALRIQYDANGHLTKSLDRNHLPTNNGRNDRTGLGVERFGGRRVEDPSRTSVWKHRSNHLRAGLRRLAGKAGQHGGYNHCVDGHKSRVSEPFRNNQHQLTR